MRLPHRCIPAPRRVKLAINGVDLAGIYLFVLSSGTKPVARRICVLHVSQAVSK